MKNYFRCTEIAKICELPGASPTGPRPGIWSGSMGGGGGGLTASPNRQLLNCSDRADPDNFREVIISSGMWEIVGSQVDAQPN